VRFFLSVVINATLISLPHQIRPPACSDRRCQAPFLLFPGPSEKSNYSLFFTRDRPCVADRDLFSLGDFSLFVRRHPFVIVLHVSPFFSVQFSFCSGVTRNLRPRIAISRFLDPTHTDLCRRLTSLSPSFAKSPFLRLRLN